MRSDDVSYHRSTSDHRPAAGSPGTQWRARSPPGGNREWRSHRSPPRVSRQGSSPPPRFRQQQQQQQQQQHEMASAAHRDSPPQQSGPRYREDSPPPRGGRYHDDSRGAHPPPRFSASSRERDGVASSAPVRESPPRVVRFSRTDDRGYSTSSQDQEDSSYSSSSNHYREQRGYQPRSPGAGSEGAGDSPRSQDGGYKGRYFDGGYGRLKRLAARESQSSSRRAQHPLRPSNQSRRGNREQKNLSEFAELYLGCGYRFYVSK